MEFSKIQPFVRYVHYLPVDNNSKYNISIPYDNRMFYMYHGHAVIQADDKTYQMNDGDVIIIPSGIKYHLLAPENKATYIAVNFDYTQSNLDKHTIIPPIDFNNYNPALKLENIAFSDTEILNGIVYLHDLTSIAGKLLKLEQEYTHKLIYFENMISNIFTEVLIECTRAAYTQKFKGNGEIINSIISYINENFNRELTNKRIGEVFNLHPNYISSLIKIFSGMPLHKYLTRVRISHSIEMLESKNYSINEIAEKCGFCSIYHYSKVFKSIIGVPPSKY